MTAPTPSTPAQPVVDAATVARRLGVTNPDDETLSVAADAIIDAESDVEGYLGRPITPTQRTVYHLTPWPWGWNIREDEPIRRIVSATAETTTDGIATGLYTVAYEVGLDYKNDPELRPVRRYIMAAALNDFTLLQYAQRVLHLRGPVESTSVSTEGQSKNVSYGSLGYTPPRGRSSGGAMTDYPGALPSKSTLDRWRIAGRRVHQAPDRGYDYREWSPDGYPRWAGGLGGNQGSDAGAVPGSSTPGDWGFPTDGYVF